jgi:hypothetical protein
MCVGVSESERIRDMGRPQTEWEGGHEGCDQAYGRGLPRGYKEITMSVTRWCLVWEPDSL